MTNPVTITLDSQNVLRLIMGGTIDVPHAGIRIIAGEDLQRMLSRIRTRVGGAVNVQGPPPVKGVRHVR